MSEQELTDQIDRDKVIPASPEEVWEAITGPDWLAEDVQMELIPGGEARFADGNGVRQGWVEEAQPPHRLVFWWGEADEPASRVEISLDPEEPGVTRLRICESRPLEILDLVGMPLPGSGGASRGPAMLVAA